MSTAETLIVTGFGRCGTTMLMQMLHAGGMPVIADSHASFESSRFTNPGRRAWNEFAGHAIKVLDPQRWQFSRTDRLRFLFLSRNAKQQARSQAKLLQLQGLVLGSEELKGIAASIRRDLKQISTVLYPHPVLYLNFEELLGNPVGNSNRIARFILPEILDPAAMAAVVRKRSPLCLPDLSLELSRVQQEINAAQEA